MKLALVKKLNSICFKDLVGFFGVSCTHYRVCLTAFGFCSIVIYPVIPKGEIILRIIPTAAHTMEDVERTIEAFKAVREKFDAGYYASMPIPQKADPEFKVR